MANIDNMVLYVKNVGTDILELYYQKQHYNIRPTQQVIVPYGAVITWFGHPLTQDISARERYRHAEYERMLVRWGIYEFGDPGTQFPKVEIYTVDDPSERIWTVIEDKDGEHISDAPSVSTTDKNKDAAIATMQKEMARMTAQIALMQDQQGPAAVTGDEVVLDAEPEDLPVAPKVKVGVKNDGPAE